MVYFSHTLNQSILTASELSHGLSVALLVPVGTNPVREGNTLFRATHYRLFLPLVLNFSSSLLALLFDFSLSMMRPRGGGGGGGLPFSRLSIIPLSVSPSGLIGVGETRAVVSAGSAGTMEAPV